MSTPSRRHTPEPWFRHFGQAIYSGPHHDPSARLLFMGTPTNGTAEQLDEAFANSARVIACVNACAGINPEAVPDLVAALTDLVDWMDNLPTDAQLDKREGRERCWAADKALAKAKKGGA
jgi:hypothetical protein